MSGEEREEAFADLTLRSQPRPVSRLSRKAIMGGAAASGGLLFGALLFAMKPPSVRTTEAALLPSTAMKPVNEAVDGLPRSYGEVPVPLPSGPIAARVPRLGPPLPGDLGSGLVETERSLGIDAAADLPAYDDDGLPFLPDAETEAMRVERIRQARITAEAREADVFFTLRSSGVLTDALGAANPTVAASTGPTVIEPRGPITGLYLAPGTVIRASLLTAVNSDLPDTAIAQVTKDVTDSQTVAPCSSPAVLA